MEIQQARQTRPNSGGGAEGHPRIEKGGGGAEGHPRIEKGGGVQRAIQESRKGGGGGLQYFFSFYALKIALFRVFTLSD